MGKGTGVEKVFRRKTPKLGIRVMWTNGMQEKALSVLKSVSAPGSFGLSPSDSGCVPSGLAMDPANECTHHVETIRVLEWPAHVYWSHAAISVRPGNV